MKEACINRISASECIYQALVELMDKKPYDEITVADITRKAGVSRMAYYRNYKKKDDILTTRLQKELQEVEARMYSRNQFSNRDFWRIILEEHPQSVWFPICKAGMFEKCFGVFREFVIHTYAHFGIKYEDEIWLYKNLGSLAGCIFYAFTHEEQYDRGRLADLVAEVFEKD